MNSLLKQNKEIMKFWNYKKNSDIDLDTLMSQSRKKVWWICPKGHEWEARVYAITEGNRCPYCSGRKRIVGVNDIFTINPNWEKYWDYETNNANNINPYDLGIKSHNKVHWICSNCGEKFEKAVSKTKNDILCTKCSRKNSFKSRNDNIINQKGSLLENYPEIAKEWNYEKNGKLKPEFVFYGSTKKVWWKCSKGHQWENTIRARTLNKKRCPYCSNQKILKGYNDLETTNPYIAKEWNYNKNKVKPDEIGAGSGKKYWWICKQGHEWEMSPLDRIYGRGCPICNSERKISIPEKTVLFYLQRNYKKEIISNYRSEIISNKEIDIYLPNDNLGIEYDGIFFHQDKARDIEKDRICREQGIKLFHIAEDKNKNKMNSNYIYYKIGKEENLEWAINTLLNNIFETDKTFDIDIKRDRTEIYNLIDYYEKEQSLLEKYPEIAKEWNYEKNGKLKPEFVSYGSEKKVWWKCSKGHEWQAVIYIRSKGTGCPYCANQKVLKGYNDFQTYYPSLAKQWNYKKNNIKPDEISRKSNKKVWWMCDKGHEWQATVISRITGNNCPYCGNQKLLKGYNDFKTKYPGIAKEWHPTKNGKKHPDDYFSSSHKKVWWLGKCGHEWQASIGDRVYAKNNCPYCSNSRLLKGYNDLKTKNPKLVKEWNKDKNRDIKPDEFFPNSHVKVWWVCPKGHEYEAYIIDRNNGNGCPICANKLIVKGINDLETINPELAKYWDINKNGLKPSEIGIGSGKRYWWKCPYCDNQWNARVVDVAKKKYICSKCKYRK